MPFLCTDSYSLFNACVNRIHTTIIDRKPLTLPNQSCTVVMMLSSPICFYFHFLFI